MSKETPDQIFMRTIRALVLIPAIVVIFPFDFIFTLLTGPELQSEAMSTTKKLIDKI